MLKVRMRYEKTDTAAYVSHLDLMRIFRRAFTRAEVPLVYSQGFNPHPYFSVPLPLPTGFESRCELLDFDTTWDTLPENLLQRLNDALPAGVHGTELMPRTRNAGDIGFAGYCVKIYRSGITPEAAASLFREEQVLLEKRTKRGKKEDDVLRYIRSMEVSAEDDDCIRLDTVLAAGGESLNPEYLVKALEMYRNAAPWAVSYERTCILDTEGKAFA